ncbi:MAG: IgGFc-binding protein [Deltaproteobacteria bacterium]|nr:IgGFc-binding protein [Deltaproteobacteria bacterium]
MSAPSPDPVSSRELRPVRPVPRRALVRGLLACYLALVAASCSFDRATRWYPPPPKPPPPPLCEVGVRRCTSSLEECVLGSDGAATWSVVEACAEAGLLCSGKLLACVACEPDETFCAGKEVRRCDAQGSTSALEETCDAAIGSACRGGSCRQLCLVASEEKSNVGCEYWGVDLDNARVDESHNAAAQQFAIVVSNPQPDVAARVRVFQDDGQPGDAPAPELVTEALIPPLNLRVFKLGPREVDGSPEGEYDAGTHTALTRHAYKITSDFPVVAYQFNPLENANVFSNDASLLKPREALTYDGDSVTLAYVVAAWPQTIAWTGDSNTNFNPSSPTNLRAFLTLVGTTEKTRVVIQPTTAIREGGAIPYTPPGGVLELEIGAFDVVNLETPDFDSFDADFTGTRISSDKPVAVFSGSEASDAPRFDSLSERRCCADHLEEQLDPVRTAGKRFAFAHSPSRTRAVVEAGGVVEEAPEPEIFRFVATVDPMTTIKTTLPPPHDVLKLFKTGDHVDVAVEHDFIAVADQPIHAAQLMTSQDAANVPRGLPGGDPSLLIVPPQEQFRADYVFLTPDKYAFDFITVVAPVGAKVYLDGELVGAQLCRTSATDGLTADERGKPQEYVTYTCQLSFPLIDPETGVLLPGMQNDGVHRVDASQPVGVMVWGFDSYVSYAYAAGTELREIAAPL